MYNSFKELRGLDMINKSDYFYQESGNGLKIIAVNDRDTDTIYIPKSIDGKPVTSVLFDERSEYQGIKVLSISADLESLYLHNRTFSKLEKIVFEKDFDGTAEFVRDLVWLWAVKNVKAKTTIPEIVFKGTPSKFIVKQHFLLSKDEKKLIVALTRESFAVPKSVNTVCTKSVLPTYKKTSVISYHSGVTTIENNPFGLDRGHMSMIEFAAPQMNYVPLKTKNIGSGLIIDKNDYHVGRTIKTDTAHFVYEGSKLTIRTAAQNITDEALQEITNLRTVTEAVIENKDSPFEVKNGLLIYKKDTAVRAVRNPNNKNPIYLPDYIKRSFIAGVKPENKSEEEIKEESKGFENNKVEYVPCSADMFHSKEFAWKGPDIKVPLSNMFRLKSPVVMDKLEVKLSDLKIPPTRKKEPDYGFAIDNSCKYIKELVLPEGINDFAIAKNLDATSFALQKIVFPSTVIVANILPKLNQFKNLMLVVIKPEKKIQVKFGGLHYILANVKKKKYDSLFYTYSYSEISDPEHESPYSSGSYGGITYISQFKQEKLLHHGNGYYYLVEDEEGRFYRLLKTDFVETFEFPKEVNGIKVKYCDRCCLSNVKNDPLKNCVYVDKHYSDFKLEGLPAYVYKGEIKYMDE